MNPIVARMAMDIVRREGGLVDDPDDRGGITNCGISLRYARGKGLVMDLDKDGDVDGDDIRLVTPGVAAALYVHDFFDAPQLDLLPDVLQPIMFDAAVLHGPGGAVKVLQRALNALGAKLTVDGGCGRKTQTVAAEMVAKLGVKTVVNAVVDRRIKFAQEIAAADPSQRKYVVARNGGKGGWITRAESFRMA